MRCTDIRRLESAYVDGELANEQIEAFRSHLRNCTACRQATTDMATLVDLTSQLEPIEPPARLWTAIKQELLTDARSASADVAARHSSTLVKDQSAMSWLTAWFRPRYLLPIGAVAAAASLILVLSLGDNTPKGTQGGALSVAGQPGEPADGPTDRPDEQLPTAAEHATHAETLANEVRAADDEYASTIAELREIVDEERSAWPSEISAAFERRMTQFEAAADRHRQALTLASTGAWEHADPSGRDALYAVYRAEIAFLQKVAIDGLPGLSGPGGLP